MLVRKITAAYKEQFPGKPVIVRSPGRANFVGEHTDYNEGYVLPAAIDRSIMVAAGASNSRTSKAIALDLEQSHEFFLNELAPIEGGDWRNYLLGVVSEIQNLGKTIGNFNLVFAGDIPIGAGLSSSAALENGIVFALNELFKLGLSKLDMVHVAHRAENNFAGVRCGIMDQFSTMFCEKGKAMLLDCRNLQHESVGIDRSNLEIVLIDTKVGHRLTESPYNKRRKTCEEVSSILNVASLRDATKDVLRAHRAGLSAGDFQKALFVIEENKRVLAAVDALRRNRMDDFGELLFGSHKGLREQYDVSCTELDFLVDAAQKSDAVFGARMMGAGFGGCTINLFKKGHSGDFLAGLESRYESRFGKKCETYEIQLCDGTQRVRTDPQVAF